MTKNANVQMARLVSFAKYPYLIVIKFTDENDVSRTIRLANTDEDLTYEGNVYTATCFDVTPPTRSNSSISDGRISFSAIDQSWIEIVRTAKGRITCEFVSCISYDDNNEISGFEEIERIKFTLINASWNEETVQFTMMFDDRMNLCIPADVINGSNTPALI